MDNPYQVSSLDVEQANLPASLALSSALPWLTTVSLVVALFALVTGFATSAGNERQLVLAHRNLWRGAAITLLVFTGLTLAMGFAIATMRFEPASL